ncbi:MAG: class E sortase, partial [Nitriliruptorales bacterium]
DPPVGDDPLVAVEGVSREQLQRGPGHYPGTALPGEDGNVVISGHRTTYGAPFFRLDELQPGDRIHVLDRARQEWVYEVRKSQVVAPTALWVTERDPLGTGAPMLTLTTCHPRFSSAQRLIVFAELVGGPAA